ncbi:hypothetical protein NKDENANG_00617 [Candidatus Entotheonellaceae bacterium PAL068K]
MHLKRAITDRLGDFLLTPSQNGCGTPGAAGCGRCSFIHGTILPWQDARLGRQEPMRDEGKWLAPLAHDRCNCRPEFGTRHALPQAPLAREWARVRGVSALWASLRLRSPCTAAQKSSPGSGSDRESRSSSHPRHDLKHQGGIGQGSRQGTVKTHGIPGIGIRATRDASLRRFEAHNTAKTG